MTSSDMPREVASMLKFLRSEYPDAMERSRLTCGVDSGEPLLALLVRSFLVWEATTSKACAALKRLEPAVVDFNELRVCMPDEVAKLLGDRYPRADERAIRMRCVLNDIFRREHAVTLEHLAKLSKRDASGYLETLDGMPAYVAARVELLGLGVHTAPVDSRILRRLVERKVIEEGVSIDDAASQLGRKVRAGDMPEIYALLQSYADDASYPASESWSDGARFSMRSTRPSPAPGAATNAQGGHGKASSTAAEPATLAHADASRAGASKASTSRPTRPSRRASGAKEVERSTSKAASHKGRGR